jgi:diguanylate cyclase (GGDEF)-like protein
LAKQETDFLDLPTSRSELLWPVAWAASVVVVSVIAVRAFSDDFVERTLLLHAESSALTWRAEFTGSVPGLSALLSGSRATEAQRDYLEATMAGSDIFRFELFNAGGDLVFLSDQALFEVETADRFNLTASETARTGMISVQVEDGRTKANRPDWYVEAYMPVEAAGGGVIGVVEVYVDVTGLAATLRERFDWLSLLLIGAAAVVYLVPTLLLILRGRQLRQRDRELLRLSMQDPLTGVRNRAAFNEVIATLFRERGPDGPDIGLLFIDLDKFKEVNDTLGHDVGDQLLTHVAGNLKAACRNNDIVARLGGDEFVILCRDASKALLQQIGERILDDSLQPMTAGTKEVYPSFSIGAHLSRAGEPEGRALMRADLAVYKAKADGRSRLVMFSGELEEREERRRSVAAHIREGAAKGLFFLEYQPIYDTGLRVSGFEALLRLNAPDGSRIPPSEFIPIAEDIGMIEELGRWVLREAIDSAGGLPEHCTISVNVSPHEFRSGTLPDYLAETLDKAGTAPHRIYLEVTESTLIESEMCVERQLAALSALGVKTALDDFGTGYSSLGYLWQYRFDRLKIDKSFLDGFEAEDIRYAQIMETIAILGHHLDADVVAEGVETPRQLEAARRSGCDMFQGFLFSRPVSLTAALELVEQDVRRTGTSPG